MLRRAGQLKQLLDNHRNLLASTVSTVSKIETILAQSEGLKGESMEEVDLIDKLSNRGFHGLIFCPIRQCTGALYGKINRMNIHFLKGRISFISRSTWGFDRRSPSAVKSGEFLSSLPARSS